MIEHVKIKCLTLWQPWASAIALGRKTIETRNWGTEYQGPLGIHAGKSFDDEAARFLPHDIVNASGVRGSILAIADLYAAIEFRDIREWTKTQPLHLCPPHWFQPGMVGWVLQNIRAIKPISVRGSQGLWDWEGDVEYLEPREEAAP